MTVALSRWALPGCALLSVALVPAVAWSAPWGTGLLVLGGAGALCYWLARRVLQDRALAWLALGGLTLRAALSVLFYSISVGGLPVVRELQLGGGFWTFAPDARHYHLYALRILDAWRDGIELPTGLEGGWYFLVLAVIYKVIGVHPLHGAWVNAAVGGFSPLLAFAIARRFGGGAAGRIGAGLVAFWPSPVLWSTQLLKEQLTIFMVLLGLYFTVTLCERVARARELGNRWAEWRVLLLLIGASAETGVIAMVRPLYALALGVGAVVVFGAVAVVAVRRREMSFGGAAIIAGVLMLTSAVVGQTINPLYALSPRTANAQVQAAAQVEADANPVGPVSPPADSEGMSATTHLLQQSAERAWRLGVNATHFPETISNLREGQTQAAGHSPIDSDVRFSSLGDVLFYLPRGSVYFFLSPFPWQGSQTGGVAGILKSVSILESALLWVVIPFAGIGAWRLLRQKNVGAGVLLVYLFIGCVVLGLTIVGLGSLFRYRVPFLLVLFVLAGVGVPSRWIQAVRTA